MSSALSRKPDAAKWEDTERLIAKQFLSGAAEGLPLYLQLHRSIEALIDTGALKPGTQMPPEQSLASALGISLGTTQKGLQSLSSKRLIVREHGRGTFVCEPRHSLTDLRLFRFVDSTGKLLPVFASVLERKVVPSGPELEAIFGNGSADYVWLSRLVDVGGRFSCHSELFLPMRLFGDVLGMPLSDLDNVNLKRLFSERLKIVADVHSQRIRIAPPSEPTRLLLSLPRSTLGLEIEVKERTDENVTTAYQKIFVPPTKYPLDIRYAGGEA